MSAPMATKTTIALAQNSSRRGLAWPDPMLVSLRTRSPYVLVPGAAVWACDARQDGPGENMLGG
jgi:hypothetical protein